MAKQKAKAKLIIKGEGVEPHFKTAHGGLVSAATLAIVTKATKKISDAREIDKLIGLIMPFLKGDMSDPQALQTASEDAFYAGVIPTSVLFKIKMSEDELEEKDDVFFSTKLSSYCDILAGCLDFVKMDIEPLTALEIADTQTWETIKEIANDFLDYVKKK